MTRTYPTNSPIKPPQDFHRDDRSVDWRRRLEYHTGPVNTPPPPPGPAPPPPLPPPPPPSDSESFPSEVEESRSEGEDTEVDIELDSDAEGRILSHTEPEQSAKHSLPGSSNPNDEEPTSVDPGDHQSTTSHTSLRSQSPVVGWRGRIERHRSSAESPSCPPTSSAQTPVEVEDSRVEIKDTEVESDRVFEERFDKNEFEEPEVDSLFGDFERENEAPQNLEPNNPPLAEPESYADTHEPEFNANTYEPENPEEYELTEEDLAFFDQPYNPS